MTNLKDIKRGDTYEWELRFWDDEEKTIPIDVSGHSFVFTAKSIAGASVITLSNTDFVQQATNIRKVTLSKVTTATYPVGDLSYQLDVTLPDGTVYTWMEGFINIVL